jgi:hypothetical protein
MPQKQLQQQQQQQQQKQQRNKQHKRYFQNVSVKPCNAGNNALYVHR